MLGLILSSSSKILFSLAAVTSRGFETRCRRAHSYPSEPVGSTWGLGSRSRNTTMVPCKSGVEAVCPSELQLTVRRLPITACQLYFGFATTPHLPHHAPHLAWRSFRSKRAKAETKTIDARNEVVYLIGTCK